MASLASYGLCQTACNAGAVTCYAANGATFGAATGGAALPAVLVACNTALGTCMSACAAKFLAEGSAESAGSGGVMTPIIVSAGALMTAAGWAFMKYKGM